MIEHPCLLDSILLYLIPLVSSLVSCTWLNCRRNTCKHGCVRPIKNACKIMQTWSNVQRQVAKWQSGWTFKQFVCKCPLVSLSELSNTFSYFWVSRERHVAVLSLAKAEIWTAKSLRDHCPHDNNTLHTISEGNTQEERKCWVQGGSVRLNWHRLPCAAFCFLCVISLHVSDEGWWTLGLARERGPISLSLL